MGIMENEITIEEQKKILFEILLYIDKVCRENNINYSLGEGTLLGAVRHKGFIPWDDDIDLLMERKDVEKFLAVHKDGRFKMYTPIMEESNCYVYRLTDPKTVIEKNGKISHGLWVALTPIDKIPDDDKAWVRMQKKVHLWIDLLHQRKTGVYSGRRIVRILKKGLFLVIQNSFLYNKLLRYLTMYKDTTTERMQKLNIRREPFVFPSTVFDGYTDLEFEGQKFMAIKHYDEYLTLMYGDYMTPPPVEKRVAKHDFKAYYID